MLKTCEQYATRSLEWGWAKACGWSLRAFGGTAEFVSQCQRAVRVFYCLGALRVQHMCELPFLLVRIEEEGVAAECITLYAATNPPIDCDTSRRVLSTDEGSLRSSVIAIRDHGAPACEGLRRIIDSMCCMNLDDSRIEETHSIAKRTHGRTPGAELPWVAATCRERQNLRDDQHLPQHLGIIFEI